MDREVRRKLSTFFRSRWFEAPFDGDRFSSRRLMDCAICANAANTEQLVAQWRKTANGVAAKQAGYAYQVYARSKSISVLDHLIAFIGDLGELDPNSTAHTTMAMEIRAWADRGGVIAPEGSLSTVADDGKEPPWI